MSADDIDVTDEQRRELEEWEAWWSSLTDEERRRELYMIAQHCDEVERGRS